MTRRLALALTTASACALVMAPAVPAKKSRVLERRAERAVKSALKTQQKLPNDRSVRCRRLKGRRATCRWRGAKDLSPNRSLRCRGRYRVRFRGRRARVRRQGGRRCAVRVAARAPWLGFNDIAIGARTASPDQVARLIENAGGGLFRLPFDWRYVERRQGTYDIEIYDRAYQALLARGIRPIILLSGAPRWSWPALTFCSSTCSVPPAPRFDASWRHIAGELARRYPRAAAIEIWNEPHESTFWHPRPSATRYADLLRQAYGAIKAVRPGMKVLGASVDSRLVSDGPNMAGAEFLRQVLGAGGGRSMDAVSVHPYSPTTRPDLLRSFLGAIRSVRHRAGHGGLPVWATEFGLTTTGPRALSESAQAAGLIRQLEILRADSSVDATIVHSLIDPSGLSVDSERGYGVVRSDLRPKPAYCALRRAAGVRGRCP